MDLPFQPLDFSSLKPQTTVFLRLFLAQLIVSSQSASPILDCTTRSETEAATLSRDRGIVELIMVKAFKQPSVVQGLLRFLKTEAEEEVVVSHANVDRVRDLLDWGMKVAVTTLASGEDVSKLVS